MNTKKTGIVLLIFFMLTLFGCGDIEWKTSEGYIERKEESVFIRSGVLIHAQGRREGAFLTHRWQLYFKDGFSVGITEDRYWFVPIGEKVTVYKYVNEHMHGKGRLYFIKREKSDDGNELL